MEAPTGLVSSASRCRTEDGAGKLTPAVRVPEGTVVSVVVVAAEADTTGVSAGELEGLGCWVLAGVPSRESLLREHFCCASNVSMDSSRDV